MLLKPCPIALLVSLLIVAGCQRPPAKESEPAADSPLIGKPAPDIRGKLLDGSEFDLKEKTANQVVLLDFWATWCGPCVLELPIVLKLAEEYQSKGVVLYTVNASEDPERIQQFLNDQGWKFNVILDPDTRHASAYQAYGLPQLVIIGKDGNVRHVHVGYNPDIERQLRSDLDALIGK